MNVINDNWLFVRYLDDEVKQISVRQAFIDADKIQNIETPVFHNTKVYIYDVPVIQLLATIVLAVYFKPENNFVAHDKGFCKKLMKNGWDLQVILDYLDHWQDRFNLFDENYPFMQDISLKSNITNKESYSYISNTSVIAPGGRNAIFEHNTNDVFSNYLIKYTYSIDELIYSLLYIRTLATSPFAKEYPNKAINANATLFIINYGKNLFETIVYNCLPLRNNIQEDDLYDRPIWELDSYKDIKDYSEELYKNTLLCTFLPCIPVYVNYTDGEIKNILLGRTYNDVFMKKEDMANLKLAYSSYNPWTIRIYRQEDDGGFEKYKEWTKNLKILGLCIDITKKLPSGFACNIVSTELQENSNAKCVIYYRQYDDMKSNVLSYGKYEINQSVFENLQDTYNHELAISYQNTIKKCSDKFNEFKNSGISKNQLENCKYKFSTFAEQYFLNTFVYNLDKTDILDTTVDILIKYCKKITKELEQTTSNPLRYAQAYKYFSSSLNKIKEEIYGQCTTDETDA